MASWVSLTGIHNPSPGTRPPASWGDGVASNLEALRGASAAEVSTSQSTTSTSFTDLATVGPTVTVDTGASALVIVGAHLGNDTGSQLDYMSFAVSGASSVAASLDRALIFQAFTAGAQHQSAAIVLLTTLTPGTNVFTAKYQVSAGTGTFIRRRLAVIPLF